MMSSFGDMEDKRSISRSTPLDAGQQHTSSKLPYQRRVLFTRTASLDDDRQRSSHETVRFSGKSDGSIKLDQEEVEYTQEATLISSQGSGTCKTKRRVSCSSSHHAGHQRRSFKADPSKQSRLAESGLSIMLAQDVQEAVKYTQETTRSSSRSLEMGQRIPRNTSSELPYQRKSSRALFTDVSDLSIAVAQDVAKYALDTTLISSPGWRITRSASLDDGRQRSSREAVRFPDKSDLSIMLDQEAVKYNHEATLMSSQGLGTCKTKRRISRSTSLDADQQHNVYLAGKSGLSIMLAQDVQEAVKYTQETSRSSSSSFKLETKQSTPRSTSCEAGWLTYQHRSSRAMPVADKSNLSILAQDVAKYTQETTRMSSPGERHSSCSMSREVGHHRSSLKQHSKYGLLPYQHGGRSSRAVHFADESGLPMMTQHVAKYTPETSHMSSLFLEWRSSRSSPFQTDQRRSPTLETSLTSSSRFLAKIRQSLSKVVTPVKKKTR